MKKQIVNVSMLQTSKVVAAIYFVVSIPIVAVMALVLMATHMPGMGMGMLLMLPVMYAVGGFLFTLLGTFIYNLVASQLGGIEFTTSEVGGN